MKNRIILSTLVIWFAQLHSLFAAPADDQQLAAADNGFAFKFLKELATEQPAANIFISPYSAATALQMVADGAAGRTRTEMQLVLGTGGMSSNAVLAANQEVAQVLHEANPNITLTMANALWYRMGAPVRPDYIARNQEFFGSTLDALDVADPHATVVINDWASEKTQGKITHIADGLIDPLFTRLILVNAVYFKAKWADAFDIKDTKDEPFFPQHGEAKQVPMMTKTGTFAYRHGSGYQAVRLPYQGDNLSMYVFLPDKGSSPEKLLNILTGDTWQRVTKPGFGEQAGTLKLPRFKVDYSVELPTPLQRLGMKTAFLDDADFSGIAPPPLFISKARQKTFVEVKEEGTEAAAATIVVMNDKAEPAEPEHLFSMVVDRPFLFLIEDNRTGIILFMGLVYDPQTE